MFDILLKKSELYGMQPDIKFYLMKYFFKSFSAYTFVFLITFFSIVACKKEKENTPPEITIQLPQTELTLNAIDSVLIKATVTDDNGPLNVSVYIADDHMNPMTASLVKSSSGNSISIDQLYFFNNKYLESGTYYLVVHAEDLVNKENKMVKIQIIEIPRVLKSIYVGIKDPSGLKIFCNDSLGNYFQVAFIASTFVDFAINNYSQQLFLLSTNGNLSCYSLVDFQKEWEKTGLNLVGNTFDGQLKEYDNLMYATDAKGYIKGYDETGMVRKIYHISLGSPVRFNFCDSKTITYVYNYNNQNKYIQTISSEGGILNTYLVSFTPYNFFPYSLNNIIVFGNINGQSVMNTYNTQISLLTPFGNPISGSFCDAVETPDNQYLLTTTNDIRIIEKAYGNSTIFNAGHRAHELKFEGISGLLYVADSNSFSVIQYPASQIISTYDFSEKILFFDFLYNK